MKGGVYLDAEAPGLVKAHFALVRATRGKRKRFPDNVVEPVASAEDALAREDVAQNLHAAEVMGPSRSSEGIHIYYLVRWLSE
jgi:hypothetical protein